MTSVNVTKRNFRKTTGIGFAALFFAISPAATIFAAPVDTDRPSPYESAVKQPSINEEYELFVSSMLANPPPGVSTTNPEGCFIAEYPNRKWIKVNCGPPSKYPNTVGSGTDFFVQATGTITKATGSFPAVFGGLSETGQIPISAAQCSTGHEFACAPNTYSLQLNTNIFSPAKVCGNPPAPGCSVWQQFIFSNHNQCGGSACVFIEYWIFNPPGLPAGTCPPGFAYTKNAPPGAKLGCFLNTPTVPVPPQPSAVLGQLQLTGQIIGGVDWVFIAPPPEPGKRFIVYSQSFADVVGLAGGWNGAEYNIVGDTSGLETFFNSKTTIKVSVQTNSGITLGCSTSFTGATLETNNLTLVPNSCAATGGTSPAIAFLESNACTTPQCALPVTISYHQVGACNGFSTSSGITSAGGNAAYVIFAVDSVDNSSGSAPFSFDPTNLFVQQNPRVRFFDPSLALYPDVLGPFAAVTTTVAPGNKLSFSPSGFGGLIVTTSNANGAAEASTTSYNLLYSQQPNDPPVNLVNSNPGVTDFTPWPLTQDCRSVTLK